MVNNWWENYKGEESSSQEGQSKSKTKPHVIGGLIVFLLTSTMSYFISNAQQDITLNHSKQNTETISENKTSLDEKIQKMQEKYDDLLQKMNKRLDDLDEKSKIQPRKAGIFQEN